MSKPRPIQDLTPDMRVRRAARLILPVRLEEAFACEAATRAGDPEAGIHDMRVAMKRFREGLRLFHKVYSRADMQPYLEKVETLNDALGRVRDRDVTPLHLLDLLARERPSAGLRALLVRLSQEREEAFSALLPLLDQGVAEGFPQNLADFIRDGRLPRGHAVAGERLRPFAHARIARRLKTLIRRLEAVAEEEDVVGLHQARIAEKKLRYSLEPFLPIVRKSVRSAYPLVCQLHDALGDVHDCDVLWPLLTEYTDTLPGPQQGPLQRLITRLQDRRRERYGQLTELLNTQVAKGFTRLARALR